MKEVVEKETLQPARQDLKKAGEAFAMADVDEDPYSSIKYMDQALSYILHAINDLLQEKKAKLHSPADYERPYDVILPFQDDREGQGVDDQRLDQRETDDHRDEDLGLGGRIAGNPLQPGSDRSALAERSPERCDRYAKPCGQRDEGLDAVAHPGGGEIGRAHV